MLIFRPMFVRLRKSKTIAGALLVFIAALLVRLPYVSYPPYVVFDENLNTSFASYYFHKKPFFDYHPPLTPVIFSLALRGKNVPLTPVRDAATHQGDFPYVRLRTLNAIAGSLLAGVVFLIATTLYKNLWFAALSASFVIFDNALIAYSRAILPETLLLLFGFSGILCWMLSDRTERSTEKLSNTSSIVWFSAAAFLWALEASMKLTGLGFVLTASLFLLYRKQYAKIAVSLAIFALTYIAIFFIFFSTIQDPAPPYTYFHNQEVQKIDFSTAKTLANFIPFFIQHHRATFLAHSEVPTDPAIHPLQWPLYHRSIGFWGKSNSERINVSGNMVIWVSTTLAVLVTLFISALKMINKPMLLRTLAQSRHIGTSRAIFQQKNMRSEQRHWFVDIPMLPLIGYLANYVPFLVVPRVLYLYHYFAALIFGFLLLPVLVQFFAHAFWTTPNVENGPRHDGKTLGVVILILFAILWYIILIPRTYGIPFYSMI